MSKRKRKIEPIVDVEEIKTVDATGDAVDTVDSVDTVDVVGQDETFADFIAKDEAKPAAKPEKKKPLTRFRLPKHLKA